MSLIFHFLTSKLIRQLHVSLATFVLILGFVALFVIELKYKVNDRRADVQTEKFSLMEEGRGPHRKCISRNDG